MISGGLFWPPLPFGANGNPNGTAVTLGASQKCGWVVRAPKTGTITEIGFLTSVVTTGGGVDVRIETVDSTGFPTGTLWGTNTNGTCTVANTDDNVWKTGTLTSGASVTQGDVFAVVLVSPAGFSGGIANKFADHVQGFPYVVEYTASWVAQMFMPIVGIKYSDGYSPFPGIIALDASVSSILTYNNTSTPDIYANKITPPADMVVSGVWAWADFDGDADIKLLGTDGVTVLASISNGVNSPPVTTGQVNIMMFNQDIRLTAGQTYYLAIEPTSATSISAYMFNFASSALRQQYQAGAYMFAASAKDPSGTGSWTDITTKILTVGLFVTDLPTAKYSRGRIVNAAA